MFFARLLIPAISLGLACAMLGGLHYFGGPQPSGLPPRKAPADLSGELLPMRYRFFGSNELKDVKPLNNEIYRVKFQDTVYSGALLEHGLIAGVMLDSSRLRGAKFNGSDLFNLVVLDSDLSGADFRGSRVAGLTAWGSDFRGADFRGADISGARFFLSRLAGARFDEKTKLPFSRDEALRRGMVVE